MAQQKRQKWEYLTLTYHVAIPSGREKWYVNGKPDEKLSGSDPQRILNTYGEQGWDLCATTGYDLETDFGADVILTYILKRPKG